MFKNINFNEMRKPAKMMLIIVGLLFGSIIIYKVFIGIMMKRYFAAHANPVMTVSTEKVKYSSWDPLLKAVGSVSTVLGVNVTAQLGGMIQSIPFESGETVKAGRILVQQNADTQIAQLHQIEANEKLAQITYDRDKAQYKVKAVSKQQVDSDLQNLKSLQAQVVQQTATVVKLTIRAPFSGRLGISKINPGQYLNPGDTVVTLQQLDPIYVDFNLPQQVVSQLHVNQSVTMVSDSYPNKIFSGKITTVSPIVDETTRNIEIEATLSNPNGELLPGMFGNVEVKAGNSKPLLTVSQTAITFNPYGEIAYIVKQDGKDMNDKPVLKAQQVFVETGETRGDQVTIVSGLKAGEIVVSSGQLKLKNGTRVSINNAVQPGDTANPIITNDHGEKR
jgi:membrane fusion protein (multidrug efflux system)